jgi:hypothetical protein
MLRAFSTAPEAVSIWCKPPSTADGTSLLALWLSITSTS